jgi:hypothetical protein
VPGGAVGPHLSIIETDKAGGDKAKVASDWHVDGRLEAVGCSVVHPVKTASPSGMELYRSAPDDASVSGIGRNFAKVLPVGWEVLGQWGQDVARIEPLAGGAANDVWSVRSEPPRRATG